MSARINPQKSPAGALWTSIGFRKGPLRAGATGLTRHDAAVLRRLDQVSGQLQEGRRALRSAACSLSALRRSSPTSRRMRVPADARTGPG